MTVNTPSNQQDKSEEHFLTHGPSSKGFAIGLYLKNLEEASLLYEQRLPMLEQPEITWKDL